MIFNAWHSAYVFHELGRNSAAIIIVMASGAWLALDECISQANGSALDETEECNNWIMAPSIGWMDE